MSKFGDAFRAARAAGKKTFTFNGESYNTKMASDTPIPPKRRREAGPPAREASAPAKETSAPAKEVKWADPGAKEGGRPRSDEPAPRKPMDGWADPGAMENEKRASGAYRKGGYVGARSSGKRMYAKGGMVKGKSCG